MLTIRNTDIADLTVTAVEVGGDGFACEFEGELAIAPGEAHELNVTFSPEDEGDFEGSLTISSDDPENGEGEIALNGSGVMIALAGHINTQASENLRIAGDYAYVADNVYGLKIIDVSDAEHPEEVAFYDTPNSAKGVKIEGDYAFVADCQSGVQIIDALLFPKPELVLSDEALDFGTIYEGSGELDGRVHHDRKACG